MIVRENLYNFHKTGNVKSDLNIGIRAKIKTWLDEMGVANYIINDDYTIDVKRYELNDKEIIQFPEFIKFRKIYGSFKVRNCGLVSLRGFPSYVDGDFSISKNNLVSLEGGPQFVSGDLFCSYNKLKNLVGSPKETMNFIANNNELESLKGSPNIVKGSFNCEFNNLRSLEGAPSFVLDNFVCGKNSVQFTRGDVKNVCEVGGVIYTV